MAVVLRCTNDDGVVADLQPLGNETIRLDISAIETSEIGDVFGVSSQNFTLPGTPDNQAFFGYLDNLGSTPAVGLSKTVPCQVLNDGMEVFTGKLYITDIVTNQKGDTIYNVVVVNETVDFKLATQDLYLAGLDWTEYDHSLTYSNITSSWTDNLFSGSVVYPLVEYGANSSNPQSTQIVAGGKERNFDNSDYALKVVDFKPSLKVKDVVDKIFDTVNYTYSSSFFNSSDFENIYMLSTQDDKNGLTFVNPVSQSFQINKDGDSYQTITDNIANKIVFGNEVFDNASNVVSSRFTADVDGLYTYYTSLQYAIVGGVDSMPDILEIYFYVNGVEVTGANTSVLIKGTTAGTAYLGPVSLNLSAGDYVEVYVVRSYETGLGSRVLRVLGTVNSKFEGIGPNTVQGGTVNVGKMFDPQVKVLDFLNGLIQKFNLVVEPIKGERNVLRIEPFNDWVDLGSTKDWTDKVDRSVKFSIKHPLQDQAKKVTFTDVEDGDSLNTYTKDKFGKTYGEYIYESDSDLALGEKTVGSFFAPTPMKYIDGAANMVVPQIFQRENGNERVAFKFKPRLLYRIGLEDNPPQLRGYDTSTSQYNYGKYFIEDEAGTVHQQSQWMLFHHLNAFPAVFDTTKDLHFGNLNQYSYHQKQFNARAKHSAFFDYWAFYINEVYDVDARLLTCNVILEPHELPQIQLNDKIFIDGHYYRINKINGANLMNEDTIEVELLKTSPRKLYFPRRRTFVLPGETPQDLTFDWDVISQGGTGVYSDYDTLLPVTSSAITSVAAAKDGFTNFGDTIVWDQVKPVQYVATQQEIQGNSTLDPSANFVKVTGDANTVKSSTQKVSVVGDNNTIAEYNEYISIDGSNNSIQREVSNVTLTNANNNVVTSGSTNITLLNTNQTAVTSSTYTAVLSDIGSDINNGSNTGTTTLVGTRNTTISGSINDVTLLGTKDINVTGGNFHIVIGKDNETADVDLNRYVSNTNVLNGTYLDDQIYLNRDALDLQLSASQFYAAYSGDALYKYVYNVDYDTTSGDGAATIYLPNINSQTQYGRSILIKCSANVSSTKQIYVESYLGTDNIDGSNRYILNKPYDWVELRASEHPDGESLVTEWQVIRGSEGISGPVAYGSFYSTSSQAITTPNVSQSVIIGNTFESQSIALSGSGAIQMDYQGTYQFTYTAEVENADNAYHYADFWIKYNGVDYPSSNTRILTPPRKSATEYSYTPVTVAFIGTAQNDNDKIELYWRGDSTLLSLPYLTGSAARPATPSIMANIHSLSGGGPTFNVTQSIYEDPNYLTTASLSGNNLTLTSTGSGYTGTVDLTSVVPTLAVTSSYAVQALTASYADNAGDSFPYTGSAEITGSLSVIGPTSFTGSVAIQDGIYSGSFVDNTTDTYASVNKVVHMITLTTAEWTAISSSADSNTLYIIV